MTGKILLAMPPERQLRFLNILESENYDVTLAADGHRAGNVLAIPHNGNLSNGKMFALSTFEGDPLTRDWAETRARWEPMYEITQIKGVTGVHTSFVLRRVVDRTALPV